jgi:hypothetical protein
MKLVGANANAPVMGSDELPGKVNYFIGNDPKKWRTNVPTYAKVRFHNVYPGVDVEYYGNQGGQLEYDFIVAPGADPSAVALDVGAGIVPARGRPQGSPLRMDGDGGLMVHLDTADVSFHKPLVYQPDAGLSLVTRHLSLVQGRFLLDTQNRVHFALGAYDHTKPLIIDPVLSYSTYLGGSYVDSAYGIAVDSSGSAYVTGETTSVDFPTVNALQASNIAGKEGTAFVAKLNAAGTALVYSTYLGGNGRDIGYGIAVDSSGDAYVAGNTLSRDFPVVNAIQNYNLARNLSTGTGFVAKLNASGSALVYSTYLGGSDGDVGSAIVVDSAGNAYVTGQTSSPDFPTTPGAFESTGGGAIGVACYPSECIDAFVTKLNAAGSALVYSTFLGSISAPDSTVSQVTAGRGIALDPSGNAYITGITSATDFPTANPLQATLKGPNNAFVAELNASGSELVYSTYLGGSGSDAGNSIAVDSSGSAYVTGVTSSTDFPAVDPFQATNKAAAAAPGSTTGFVAKLNPGGSALAYSTYLGGSWSDAGYGIAVDSSGDAYVVGSTESKDFPTANPVQSAFDGEQNAFVTELNPAGSALVYSTYLGGSVQDTATGVAVDSSDNVYVAGNTGSPDFPTVNPLQASNAGATGKNLFVARLSLGPAPALSFSANSLSFGAVLENTTSTRESITVSNVGNAPLDISGIDANGEFALVTTTKSCSYGGGTLQPATNCTIDLTFTPTTLAVSSGSVTVTDNAPGSPHTVQLAGSGAVSAADISPAVLNYNNTTIGTTSGPQAVTLTNTAPVALAVSNVTTSSGWTQTNNCMPSVPAGTSCTINVSFQPTVGGTQAGALTVTDDALNGPQTVPLNGTGLGGVASLSPTSLNFGSQPLSSSGSAVQWITLLNSAAGGGSGVPEISVTGDFQQSNGCDAMTNLVTDSPCAISVWFQPTAVGLRAGTLTVTYPGSASGPLTASLTGIGAAPEAAVSTATLTFAGQPLGSASSALAVNLSNTGNAPLVVFGISASGDFSETNTCGTSVSANGSCTINVTFTPTTPGARSGTLAITDNSNLSESSAQTVSLSGTGTAPAANLSATSLSFAGQLVGTASSAQQVTLQNTGNLAMSFTGISLTGANSSDFSMTQNCGSSLAVNASCQIKVAFTPSAGGSLTGALTITDNAPDSPQTVQLSGTGMDFQLSSTATSQTVSPGQVANYSLTLAPEGGFNQAVNLTCTGAPSESTCTLTPNTVTLNGTASGTVAVAVSTTAPSLAPPQGRFLPPGFTGLGRMFWLYALLGLAGLATLAAARKRGAAYLLGACVLLVILWSACGGGGTSVPPPSSGTPAGTYTVDVTATDATSSTLTHDFKFTLTVQ